MLLVKVALHSVIFFKRSQFFQFLVLILALIATSSSQAQQQPALDELASQAASAIHKSVKSGGKKILVVDFGVARAKPNELAVVLADRFADALRKNTQGLVVLDRNGLHLCRGGRPSYA